MNKKELYESLSEDLKAKLKTCKSEEEMMKVLDEEKIELDPAVLEGVSGGDTDDNCCECNFNVNC